MAGTLDTDSPTPSTGDDDSLDAFDVIADHTVTNITLETLKAKFHYAS